MRLPALLFAVTLAPTLTAGEVAPTFWASVHPLSPAERSRMEGRSWHAGCPVPLDDLAAIELTHVGFDGLVHDGVLVVHRKLASEAIEIFRALFDAGFPIERMQPYEDFPVGKYAASNDTVGFYCRPAQDDPTVFSSHAYGFAIDINPTANPFDDPKEGWWPAGTAAMADRTRTAPGLLAAGGAAVKAFMDHGWAWGGIYRHPDYMHFNKVVLGDGDPLKRPVWAERLGPVPP